MLTARLSGSQATRPLLVLFLVPPLLLIHVSKAADTISRTSGDVVNKRSESLRHIELLSRRSALDKNFMRFGRAGAASNYMRLGRDNVDNMMRFGRGDVDFNRFAKGGRDDNYMRFGRAGDSNYMRFGRRNNDDNTSNYMRFGRADMSKLMRFGRANDYEDFERYARRNNDLMTRLYGGKDDGEASNFMRFARPAGGGNNDDGTNFMRFGRGPDNFMRFGRDSGKNGEVEEPADNHPLMPISASEHDDSGVNRERRSASASWSDIPHAAESNSVIQRQQRRALSNALPTR